MRLKPIDYVIAAVLLIFLAISSCATFTFGKTLVVTGESLKALGTEFVQVSAAYKQGCDVAKTIPQPQCASFRTFGQHFQKSYPLTVQLWEEARSANDKSMQGKVEDVIVELTSALSEFAVQVIPQGGK